MYPDHRVRYVAHVDIAARGAGKHVAPQVSDIDIAARGLEVQAVRFRHPDPYIHRYSFVSVFPIALYPDVYVVFLLGYIHRHFIEGVPGAGFADSRPPFFHLDVYFVVGPAFDSDRAEVGFYS